MPKRPQSPRATPSPAVQQNKEPNLRDVHKRQQTKDSASTKDSPDGSQGSKHTRGSRATLLSVASARHAVAKNGNRSLVGAFATFGICLLTILAITMKLAPGHHDILMNTYQDILPRYIELRSATPDVCTLEPEQEQPAAGFPIREQCVETSADISEGQQEACLLETRSSDSSGRRLFEGTERMTTSALEELFEMRSSNSSGRRLFEGTERVTTANVCPEDGCTRWQVTSCPCAANVGTADNGLVPAVVALEQALGQTFSASECAARCLVALMAQTWPQIETYAPGDRSVDGRRWACRSPTGPHRTVEHSIEHTVESLNNGTAEPDCMMPLSRAHPLDCTVLRDGRVLFGQRAMWVMVRRSMDAVSVNKRVDSVKQKRANATNAQAGRTGQDATGREKLGNLDVNQSSAGLSGKQEAMLAGYKTYPVEPVAMEYFVARETAMHNVGTFFFILMAAVCLCSCTCFWLIFWAQEVEKKLFAEGDVNAWDPSQNELRPDLMAKPHPPTASPSKTSLDAIAEDPSADPSTLGRLDISELNPPDAPVVTPLTPRDGADKV